jgi:hypothetical protein
MAAGNRRGLANLFSRWAQCRQPLGPLLAALIIVPYGQSNILWFSLLAFFSHYCFKQVGFLVQSAFIFTENKTQPKQFSQLASFIKSRITVQHYYFYWC